MKGRECNVYFVPFKLNENASMLGTLNHSQIECAHFAIQQEITALQKRVENSFPGEDFQLILLDSLKDFRDKKKFTLIILAKDLKELDMSLLYEKLLTTLNSPLLFIPEETKFSIPGRILLTVESNVDIKQLNLSPLKNLYGNLGFYLEIHKFYSAPCDPEKEKRDMARLKELFDIYHPVVKIIDQKRTALLDSQDLGQKYDLQIVPLKKESLEKKMYNMNFSCSLLNQKVPLLIIPETEKDYQLEFKRSRQSRKRTLYHS
jgi:hypothetical protein